MAGNNPNCAPKQLIVIDDSDSDDPDLTIAQPHPVPNSKGDLSGFIPLAGGTPSRPKAGVSGRPAHSRYGIPSLGTPVVPASTAVVQESSSLSNQIEVPANYQLQMLIQNLKTNISSLQTNISSLQNGQTPSFATPGHRGASAAIHSDLEQMGVSEWPQPPRRTGPPAGTKVTEERPEVIVRPIQMPRSARLTTDQVNHELQACIEDLASSGVHVAMERLENFLLQKFRVNRFGDLGLRERNITFLQAGRDHSNMLGKVNSYVQNFVRARSLCTLHELHECLRDFHPEKKEFEELKLGPLQKMPVVYELFKFPEDEHIPEISSLDLMENLNEFLCRFQKWQQKVDLTEFMEYLTTEVYKVERAYSLGIRLRSIPLAIQMLKKSSRDAATTRKLVIERMKQLLYVDIQEAFHTFRTSIMQNGADGSLELRKHYMSLEPEATMREIHCKFEILLHLFVGDSSSERRKMQKYAKAAQDFMQMTLSIPLPRTLFHLAVCLSSLEVQESAADFLVKEAEKQQQKAQRFEERAEEKRTPPSTASVTDKTILYLNRCLEHGAVTLTHLQRIEAKLLEDFEFASFQEMLQTSFLDFLGTQSKLKTVLEECGGLTLGQGSGHGGQDGGSGFIPSQLELLEFVCQARKAGASQPQQVEKSLCEQYCVTEARQLGHGNIMRLCNNAEKPGKHSASVYNTNFEAAICGKSCPSTQGMTSSVGSQGSQSRGSAMACLTNCPLLEDMARWSHWELVFQPQHGTLRDFVQKYGGQQEVTLPGGDQIGQSDFLALEVAPGQLLKLTSRSSPADFQATLQSGNVLQVAGVLTSLIVANGGLEATPLALLANFVKSQLFSLHAQTPALHTPGAPPAYDEPQDPNLAVQFVTEVMLRLPERIAVAVANQVLLEPLSAVVGSAKSKSEILQLCRKSHRLGRLELLGCLLGLPEWTVGLIDKCMFPARLVAKIVPDEIMGVPSSHSDEIEDDDDNDDDEDDEEEEESDIDEILSGDDNKGEEETLPRDRASALEGSSETSNDDEDEDEDDDEDDDDDSEEETEEENNTKQIEGNISNGKDGKPKGLKSNETDNKSEKEEKLSSPSEKEGIIDSENPDLIEEAVILTQAELCQAVVDSIRREEFGVGVKLDETGERLLLKQQERQGRSLLRLSKDLYSKDTHFVLELIQNADDNSYSQPQPALKFIIEDTGVTVLNNEDGFEERNIRALCDVGKSTKGKHHIGYIGQKGIGFKSVFRVTGRPEIHSNGFHICFDVQSGPMGYILPHWAPREILDESWQTQIILPWTDEIRQQLRSHAARFNDIQPTLLLFLHRLREITICNLVEQSEVRMVRHDLGEGEVQITHGGVTDRWLVLRRTLDASQITLQAKSGVNVQQTEIALAFPLKEKHQILQVQKSLSQLPVFAFLPLRSYGFRFIIQGDFDVPSSREDVDRDSSWNQWLRTEIPALFVDALDNFKLREDLNPVEALSMFLQFVPLDGEVMGFFSPVTAHILTLLKDKNCMPTVSAESTDSVSWRKPHQCVLCQDPLVREIVSPQLLQHQLGLSYLHPEVLNVLDPTLTRALGVSSVSVEHLLHIGRFIGLNWDYSSNPDHVMEISKWLACIYRSLDTFQDNTETLSTLRSLKIIPLSCGRLVALEDTTVFLLSDSQPNRRRGDSPTKGARDPLFELKTDLDLVHEKLTSTDDPEVNSQVVKLLVKMEIKQLTARDLIHSHIVPVLASDQWKDKSREVLTSYLVYIKGERDKNSSVVDMDQLRPLVRLVTNHGIKNPGEDDVHFSAVFGNPADLQRLFPTFDWILVDGAYLNNTKSRTDVRSWHDFLSELGVVDFLRVRRTEVTLEAQAVAKSPWSTCASVWPDSPEGYVITDWACEEFHRLATGADMGQMEALFTLMDSHWDTRYSRFIHTELKSTSGDVLKQDIETSFSIHLRTLAWVPARQLTLTLDDETQRVVSSDTVTLALASDVYAHSSEVEGLLAHTVPYLKATAHRASTFANFLRVKTSVYVAAVKDALISWSTPSIDSPNTPQIFFTSYCHITTLYKYLVDNLSNKDGQDLFHTHPVIFVPRSGRFESQYQPVVGRMLGRQELWWQDPTELFGKYRESLARFKSPLAKVQIIAEIYTRLIDIFTQTVRVQRGPDTLNLAQLLEHLATVFTLGEKDVLSDTLYLFSEIGFELGKISEKTAGVPTKEAQEAEINLPLVTALLVKANVFPTKLGQWVGLSAHPMMSDSSELEAMFLKQPGVHILNTLVEEEEGMRGRGARFGRDRSRVKIQPDCVEHFLSLFPEIQPLSECVKTTEITVGFSPCASGQTYLHNVVPHLQRFIYFVFKDVYNNFKETKADHLKDLLFTQVDKLEVKYELKHQPEVFKVQKEKCLLQGNHFYFHKDSVGSQAEVNREVAKFFSGGNEDCVRELRSFLSQLVSILESRSDETVEALMSRQKVHIGRLPPSESVWEVPLPVILEPEPEPEPEPPMVYGKAIYAEGAKSGAEASSLRQWPPRSSEAMGGERRMGGGQPGSTPNAPSSQWPPPQPSGYNQRSKADLPSTIRFEEEKKDQTGHDRVQGGSSGNQRLHQGNQGSQQVHGDRQSSTSSEGMPNIHRQNSDSGKRKLTDGSIEDQFIPKRLNSKDDSETRTSKNEENMNGQEGGHKNSGNTSGSGDRGRTGDRRDGARGTLREGEDNSERHESPSEETHQGPRSRSKSAHRSHSDKDLQMKLPLWAGQNTEVSYVELCKGGSLPLPSVTLGQDTQVEEIGRWGERLVWDYLQRTRQADRLIEDVIWPNENEETGKPYDFEILYKSDKVDEVYSVFVEVKTTLSHDKEVFPISLNQIQFALDQGEHFQIYRVFGAGKGDTRLLRVDNIADRLKLHQVKLLMLL